MQNESCRQCGAQLPDDSTSTICRQCDSAIEATVTTGGQDTSIQPTIDGIGSANADDRDEIAQTVSSTGQRDSNTDSREGARRFGDYELEDEIARGGMGVVFRARQISLNRPVALKMILSAQLASEADVQRFYLEAESAAQLDHVGIVPIFEVGENEGQHFFSMGLVEGGSLNDLVKRGPLAPRKAAELLRSIAEAVQYAHARNIVHRDLKPANVLLDDQGRPKVTDFGLAKNADQDSGLTATGQVMGTPAYMPPEQASGRINEVGPLADVYSLGAILYFLLTGRAPFQGANVIETLKQVVEVEPTPPKRDNKQIDLDLETICLKCLRKEPENRYASAAELGDELGRFLRGEPIIARPVGRTERIAKWIRRNKGLSTAVAAAVLALLIGSAVASWQAVQATIAWGEAESGWEKARLEEGNARAAAAKADEARADAEDAARHANRQRLEAETAKYAMQLKLADIHYENFELPAAQAILGDTNPDLRNWEFDVVKQRCDGRMKYFGRPRAYIAAAITPNGKLVAGGGNGGAVEVFDYDTKELVAEFNAKGSFVLDLAFSPDGKRLAGATDAAFCVWDVATKRRLGNVEFEAPPEAKFPTNTLGRFSRMVCFDAIGNRLATGLEQEIQIWDASLSEKLQTIDTGPGKLTSIAFDPVQDRIAACRRPPRPAVPRPGAVPAPSALVYDATTGELQQEFVIGFGNMPFVHYDPNGRTLLTAGSPSAKGLGLSAWDPDTGKAVESPFAELKRPYTGSFDLSHAEISSDGARLALVPWINPTMYLMDLEAGQLISPLQMPEKDVNGLRSATIAATNMSADGRRLVAATSHIFSLGLGQSDVGQLVGVAVEGDLAYIDLNSKSRGKNWHWRGAAICEKAGWIARAIHYPRHIAGQSIEYDLTNQGEHFLVEFHSIKTGDVMFSMRRFDREFDHLLASSDGRSLFEFHGSTIEIWDPHTRRRKRVIHLDNPREQVQDFPVLSVDDRLLATVEGDKTEDMGRRRYRLVIREARSGEVVWQTKENSEVLGALAFSTDGSRLLVSAKPQRDFMLRDPRTGAPNLNQEVKLRVYDTEDGELIAETKESFENLVSGRFLSLDRIVLATRRGLRIWNPRRDDLETVSEWTGQLELIRGGARLMVADRGVLRVIDVETMQELYQIPTDRTGPFYATPSGDTVMMHDTSGAPKLLRIIQP